MSMIEFKVHSPQQSQYQGELLRWHSKWRGKSILGWLQSGQREWPNKVNTCERKWWFLSEPKLGQRRGWWRTACRSLKSLTYHIMIDYGSHQASTFHNPELCPYLCQGLLGSIVPYTIVCLSTIIGVNGWSLGSNTGCMVLYGMSALASLPLHRHISPCHQWIGQAASARCSFHTNSLYLCMYIWSTVSWHQLTLQ